MEKRPPTLKNLPQKVSMHFPSVQGRLNNISKVYYWGITENGVTTNIGMLLFDFAV